jgi:polyhydroxyalkanoate synthesis regulator phasin
LQKLQTLLQTPEKTGFFYIMNSQNLTETIQKGFHITLGATAALVESFQDPEKRQENLTKIQSDIGLLTEEWAAKGSLTEQEARHYVDGIFSQKNASPDTPPTTPPTESQQDINAQVQELTAQLAALRAELEKLQ